MILSLFTGWNGFANNLVFLEIQYSMYSQNKRFNASVRVRLALWVTDLKGKEEKWDTLNCWKDEKTVCQKWHSTVLYLGAQVFQFFGGFCWYKDCLRRPLCLSQKGMYEKNKFIAELHKPISTFVINILLKIFKT